MSGATPTLIPRVPNFPILLPRPPQPHIKPKARRVGPYTTINQTRDLQREMDELSEEENELEEAVSFSMRQRDGSLMNCSVGIEHAAA